MHIGLEGRREVSMQINSNDGKGEKKESDGEFGQVPDRFA